MAGMRRAPKPKPKARAPIKAPIHQRILGRAQVDLDILDDLDAELEKAYDLDQIEYDDYLDCQEALTIRRLKANEAKAKAIGSYVKPEKVVDVKAKIVRRYKMPLWQKKVLILVIFFAFLKFFC